MRPLELQKKVKARSTGCWQAARLRLGPTLRRTSALVTEWSQNWGHLDNRIYPMVPIRLGHESLDVTLAYLKAKDAESEEAQEHANSSSLALYA